MASASGAVAWSSASSMRAETKSWAAPDGVIVDSITGPVEIPGNRWDSRMCRYRHTHRWYYMPDMEPDDLILFNGCDSDMPDAMNAMHSAFTNPLGQTSIPRRII